MTKHLKVKKKAARWTPHLLTPKQNRVQVKFAKELLKIPKYDIRKFANIVRRDESKK